MSETLTSILGARREMAADLERLNGYLQVALDNTRRGVSMFDARQRLVLCNATYRQIYDLPDELTRPGTSFTKIIRFYSKRESGRDDEKTVSDQVDWVRGHVASLTHGQSSVRIQDLKDGRRIKLTIQPLPGGGWVDVQDDLTLSEAEALASTTDDLTGLPNRLKVKRHLAEVLQRPGAPARLSVDIAIIEDFSGITSRLGVSGRNCALKSVTEVLRRVVRPADFVARIDGDMFAILHEPAEGDDAMASSLVALSAMKSRFAAAAGPDCPNLIWSSACAPDDGTDIDRLIVAALSSRS